MRSLVFNVLFYSKTLIYASFLCLVGLVSGPKTVRALLRRHARATLWLTRNVLGAQIEIRGIERFSDGKKPQLIVCKHQSELDPFLLFADYPEVAAIAMSELSRYPLIGPVIRKLGYILVSVEGAQRRQLRDVVTGAKQVAAEDRPILIYPEGELMRIGSRQRYKTGVYHIYASTGYEATPVALCSGLVWPQRKWTKKVGQTAVMAYLEPIPPGLDRVTFMAEIEKRIEEGTMALIREHGDPATIAIAEERYAKGLTNDDAISVADLEAASEVEDAFGGDEAGASSDPQKRSQSDAAA